MITKEQQVIPKFVTIIQTNNHITIRKNKEQIIINRENKELFEEVSELIEQGDTNTIYDLFGTFKERLNTLSNGLFDKVSDNIVIKGTDIAVPKPIMKKLNELRFNKDEAKMLGLLRFWIKLQENPDNDVRERLYGFIEHCNVPITTMGDMLLEKGVAHVKDSYEGHLVDLYSHSIKNDIGTVVEMKREHVNPDSSISCSHGLHVSSPEYVRKYYGDDTIVECLVDPKDVCAIPDDYRFGKMRVCRYKVVGYSDKNDSPYDGSKIVKLEDYLQKTNDKVKDKVSKLFNEQITDEQLSTLINILKTLNI